VEAGPGIFLLRCLPMLKSAIKASAGVMILAPGDQGFTDRPVIRVANPRAAFAALLELFRAPETVARESSAKRLMFLPKPKLVRM
jgi:UDP-3-O-[3-hydroxymyristoyl] glucosamine N-acyltransferase